MPDIMNEIMNVITAINGTENNGLNDKGLIMKVCILPITTA